MGWLDDTIKPTITRAFGGRWLQASPDGLIRRVWRQYIECVVRNEGRFRIITLSESLLEQVRSACEEVTATARYVHINVDRIPAYAAALPFERLTALQVDPRDNYSGDVDDLIAFVLTLDSVNFGSGYFPQLRLASNSSGYFAIASALKQRFETQGPLRPEELANLSADDCAEIFQQDIDNKSRRELMSLFGKALNDLGVFILARFDGSFSNLVRQANSSVESLVKILVEMPYFRDVARYKQISVPFYKRAQITAADLSLRFDGQGLGAFNDLERLTIFADNAVPHVLRLDGIIRYENSLASRIERGQFILAGSDEEVEIRASALHASELLVRSLRDKGHEVMAMGLDFFLWNRGQNPKYRAVPRHLTQTVFY